MRFKVGRKGAVLIMTMMAVSLMFMMVSSLMQTTGIGLHNASSFYDRESAMQAAQSGLDYAVTRMQDSYGWRGDSNCKYWSGSYKDTAEYGSANSGLYVAESNGNVVGLLTTQSGAKSAFRIKYSYEDTDEQTYTLAERNRFGAQGTNDLATTLPIKLPYVSVNNLQSDYPTNVYRAESDGVGVDMTTANLEVGQSPDTTPIRAYACTLPGQRALVIVEGLAGKALRDCKTPADVNKIANNGNIGLVRRYVESYYSACAPSLDGNAAFAKKSVNFNIANKLFVSSIINKTNSDESYTDKSTIPAPGALRSDESTIAIKGGKLNTYNGTIYHKDGQSVTFTADSDKYIFIDSKGNEHDDYVFDKNAVQLAQNNVEPIAFEDVAQVESTVNNNILAGMYQWHLKADSTSANPKYELRYYSGGYHIDSKKRPIPDQPNSYQIAVAGPITPETRVSARMDSDNNAKVSIGSSDKIKFVTDDDGNITEPTLILEGGLYCNGNFAIGCDPEAKMTAFPRVTISSRRETEKSKTETNFEDGILRVNGDVYIASSLYGSGAVVSPKDVTFLGGSILDSGDSGVAIYGENVNLLSLDVAMDTAPNGVSFEQDMTQSNVAAGDICTISEALRHQIASDCTKVSRGVACGIDDKEAKKIFLDYMEKKGIRILANSVDISIDKSYIGLYNNNPLAIIVPLRIKFEYAQPDGINRAGSPQEVHLDKNIQRYYTGWDQPDNQKSKLEVPREAIIDSSKIPPALDVDNPASQISENLQEYASTFGSLCYGDQTFGGVIYAQNNFTADLGGKYNLSLRGALRAEKGSIKVNGHSASIVYDETLLRKLMPGYNKLTQGLWNCW